jgi:septation ring formation regulator EzrA
MENSEKDTLPNLQTVLDAINSLRTEMNERFSTVEQRLTNVEQRLTNVEQRLTNVEQRLANVETDVREIKEMQFVFENEFDRLTALAHKSLQLSHENRADVRIMRKEIEAWSADVRNLEKQVA